MLKILIGGGMLGLIGLLLALAPRDRRHGGRNGGRDRAFARMTSHERRTWRMPPLDHLPDSAMTMMTMLWMGVLRGYLLIAVALIAVKVAEAATGVTLHIPQFDIAGPPNPVRRTRPCRKVSRRTRRRRSACPAL
jgi:hypothetical protein